MCFDDLVIVTNMLILLKSILSYKINEGLTIKDHMSVFDDLVMRLKDKNLKFEEELLAIFSCCVS